MPEVKNRPEGSNWGEFGPDDVYGRMNLLTPERRTAALAEAKLGKVFCLSHPMELPGKQVLNGGRKPPVHHPVLRDGHVDFNLEVSKTSKKGATDVSADECVMLYTQYSTHWDGFSHKGCMFDADGDGVAEKRFYNGYTIVDDDGQGLYGELGARHIGIETMAETCVQGRGVLVNLYRYYGEERVEVTHKQFMEILEKDNVVIEEGDILCLHTGLGKLIRDADGNPPESLRTACAVLDGRDDDLLQWITDSGISAIAADNLAVERSSTLAMPGDGCHTGPNLPLHSHCIFKLGIHLGELWYLTELAEWLHENKRNRFLLTAPPLRLTGAAGSPVTPVATV